jgi:hypothetical protein
MNNLLSTKNEEMIKQTSADFYTMTVYSKDILGLDEIRIKEFITFNEDIKISKGNNNKQGGRMEFFNYILENKFKFVSGISFSFLLMYKFRSVLIIPIFFSGYHILNKLIVKNLLEEDIEKIIWKEEGQVNDWLDIAMNNDGSTQAVIPKYGNISYYEEDDSGY